MTKPKKSQPKKKIVIVEDDSVPKEHDEKSVELIEKSMYERHSEMFERNEGPVSGTMTYNIAYIRSEPKQKARILKIVYKDAPLSLLSEDEDGWIKVKPLDEPKFEGYIKSAFVQKAEG